MTYGFALLHQKYNIMFVLMSIFIIRNKQAVITWSINVLTTSDVNSINNKLMIIIIIINITFNVDSEKIKMEFVL